VTVFINRLQRILKSKIQLLVILLFPIVTMSMAFISSSPTVKLAFVDHDQTDFTTELREQLEENFTIVTTEEHSVEASLLSYESQYALIIDQGFTSQLLEGNHPAVRGAVAAETNLDIPVKNAVNRLLLKAYTAAGSADGNEETFIALFKDGVNNESYRFVKLDNGSEHAYLMFGMVVYGILLTAVVTTSLLVKDRENRTLQRLLAAPVRFRSVVLQQILALLVISILQSLLLTLVARYIFGVDLGPSLPALFGILTAFATVSVGYGMFIGSLTRNVMQAVIIGAMSAPPLAMLGGAYWPIETVPEWLQNVATFVPVTWAMDGINQLMNNQSTDNVMMDIGVLFLFTVLFFLLGTLRKADMTK